MNRNPPFRFPPTAPAPKTPDWPLLRALGTVTLAMVLACVFIVCKMLGWL